MDGDGKGKDLGKRDRKGGGRGKKKNLEGPKKKEKKGSEERKKKRRRMREFLREKGEIKHKKLKSLEEKRVFLTCIQTNQLTIKPLRANHFDQASFFSKNLYSSFKYQSFTII